MRGLLLINQAGMCDIDEFSNLAAEVSFLTKQLQASQLQNTQASSNVIQSYSPSCEFCNGPHQSNDCQVDNPFGENDYGMSPIF